MCTTARTIKCNFCKRSGRVHPCFVYMFLQTPQRAYFSGKRFVPLIFHLFSIEGGARHPWQLSAIATAIAT